MSTPPTRVVPVEDGGFTNARAVETRPVLSDVPRELADRFLLVAELSRARRPAEAVVLRVRDLTARHGAPEIPLVLKWYHRLHAPGPDVEQELRELAEEEAPHLERLLETGEAHGHPWHLYWSHGEEDLARYHADHCGELRPETVKDLVGQLYDALTALHGRGVVHRDITPDNIMVQTRRADTADLVLIDFGAAVHRPEEAEEPRTDWRGKPLYLAPEAGLLRQTVSEAGDWWSLGMVIAQLALGRHPVDFRRDEEVLAEIATHDPDLSGIGDRRTRRLCEGLLTRAPEKRWHAGQVGDWLDGKDPDVAPRTDERVFDDEDPRPAIRPFPFMGREFTGTDALALHLDQNHVSAARMLAAADDRGELVAWLGQFETTGARSPEELRRLAALRAELDRPPSAGTVVRLLNWLGPGLDVSWHGADLDVRGMRLLCQGARDGHADAVSLLRHLAERPAVLTGLAQRPGGHGLDETGRAWHTLRAGWEPTVRELRGHEIGTLPGVAAALRRTDAVDAWLLQLAREPERTRSRLTDDILRRRALLPERVPWFDALLDAREDDLRLLAAHLLYEQARFAAEELRRRRLVQEADRMLAADQAGLLAVLRRLDRLPTLGWALLGATVVTAPWTFVIGLADVLGRAAQDAVVTAWLEALPAAAFVFAAELWTAAYIGPPFYHPERSLAGLLIRHAERPARLARTRAGRYLTAALLVLAVFLGFYAIVRAPWVWPLASAVAVAVWSVRRCLAHRRLRRPRDPESAWSLRRLLAWWRGRHERRRLRAAGLPPDPEPEWGLRRLLAWWWRGRHERRLRRRRAGHRLSRWHPRRFLDRRRTRRAARTRRADRTRWANRVPRADRARRPDGLRLEPTADTATGPPAGVGSEGATGRVAGFCPGVVAEPVAEPRPEQTAEPRPATQPEETAEPRPATQPEVTATTPPTTATVTTPETTSATTSTTTAESPSATIAEFAGGAAGETAGESSSERRPEATPGPQSATRHESSATTPPTTATVTTAETTSAATSTTTAESPSATIAEFAGEAAGETAGESSSEPRPEATPEPQSAVRHESTATTPPTTATATTPKTIPATTPKTTSATTSGTTAEPGSDSTGGQA
ncbi:protein kinase [Streptomyces sp. SUK 48]|uniref:protein kinase domain-containing protein n=1 Tax=Streptomyces sp. SUK 48 TaxID=2582831 RepID=UPI00129B2A22|nr:protein kinase [Streptomyces sp. SUK 48]